MNIIYILFGGDNPDVEAKREIYNRIAEKLVKGAYAAEAMQIAGFPAIAGRANATLAHVENLLHLLENKWAEMTPAQFADVEQQAENHFQTAKLILVESN